MLRGIKPRFFFLPSGHFGAIEYYRAILPLRALEDVGLAECWYSKGSEDPVQTLQLAANCDFVLMLNRPGLREMARARDLLSLEAAPARPYGDIKHPPSLIWSLDDNYHWVHPSNPSFQYNGYRLMDGTEIKNNESIMIPTTNGTVEPMWVGGQKYNGEPFLPEENKKRVLQMDKFIQEEVLSCTFTSERLRQFYVRDHGYKPEKTTVLPNCLEFDDYLPLLDSKFVRTDGSTRVLWQGGASHFMDLYPLRDPLIRLVARNPKLQIIIWGQLFTWVTRELPDDNFRSLPWVHYEAYKPLMSMLDYDFALAPLQRNQFNDSKSAIKVYESAAVGKPTLAANVPPYSDEFVDGETAMLYDPRDSKGFEERFEALAKDPELRDRIAKKAAEWCREHRDIRKWIKPWYEHLQALRGPNWSPNPHVADLVR